MATTISAQSLTDRQKHLATVAALETQGDIVRLEPAICKALEGGLTINEIKEAFAQLYAYTGFPRSLNALGVLGKVLELANGKYNEGKPWVKPQEWDDAKAAYELGVKNQTKLFGAVRNEFSPQNDYYLKAHLFGDIFAGDLLSAQDREVVTVAALSALKGAESQLAAHKIAAVKAGNSQETIDELCLFLSQQGLSCQDASADAQSGAWRQGEPNPYGQFFIGQSYLSDVHPKNFETPEATEGIKPSETSVIPFINVTFEPGCRNNWHIHHGARQILICVSGKGWYQEWGKPAIALEAGDIIEIPEGVKHWHGAQKDSWFQHLATHIKTSGEERNEWLEPVSDEIYQQIN